MNNTYYGLDTTWYSPLVSSIGTFKNDDSKTSDRYKERILIADLRGQHIQFIQKRWFPTTQTNDTLVYIDSKYQYRPDIISVDYYNTPLYAWAILAANGLRSIWQLTAGTYVKIPNIAAVTGGLK